MAPISTDKLDGIMGSNVARVLRLTPE